MQGHRYNEKKSAMLIYREFTFSEMDLSQIEMQEFICERDYFFFNFNKNPPPGAK